MDCTIISHDKENTIELRPENEVEKLILSESFLRAEKGETVRLVRIQGGLGVVVGRE